MLYLDLIIPKQYFQTFPTLFNVILVECGDCPSYLRMDKDRIALGFTHKIL